MEIGNRAYESLIDPLPAAASTIRELPVDKLRPFFTTDIGFHPYPPEKLRAFAQQLLEQGLLERIIVRSIPDSDEYEILAGHNRTAAWRMAGHDTIPAEVVAANDARAIIIATATNLLRRQELTIIERGKAYKATDDCYIIAEQKDGVYYAKGFAAKKPDATTFIPNAQGHIVVKGLEDGAYSLTEIATDKGYVLLKDAVKIVIKTAENGQCEKCGAKLLTASATVNGKDASMTEGNAIVPLTVVNNPGFDLPKTGGYGTWMFTIGGVILLGAAAFIVIRSRKHKNEQ